ncbi:MAG TPA: rhomboid family intramembrane serine protease [Actinopolymorphaceae bacterium]
MSQPPGPSGWDPPQASGPDGAGQPAPGRPTHWDAPVPVPAAGSSPASAPSVCYRHPDREAHIVCQRCGRPICPDCMIPAAVGFQCPECVRDGAKTTAARTEFGGRAMMATGTVTKVLIAVSVVTYGLQYLLGSRLEVALAMLPGPAIMSDGSLGGVASGEYWRLLTAAFLHAGLLHIAVNMFSLYQIGPALERQLGRSRFVAVYLISALGSSVAVYFFSPSNQLVVGASGAVFGIFGAAIVLWRKLGYDIRPAFVVLGINVVINVIGRGVLSWQGHVGGILTGVLLAIAIGYMPGKGESRRRYQWLAMGALTAVLVLLVVIQTVRLQVQ